MIEKKLLDNKWIFIILCCVGFVGEYFLFRQYILREVAPYYPFAFDQSGFLTEAYGLYDNFKKQGFFHALNANSALSTSVLFVYQAALFFLAFGASRLNALTINFIYLIFLQSAIIYSASYYFKKKSIAFIFLGLFLSTNIFITLGGIYDFRIDFSALCIYGVCVCFVIRSDIFLDRKWSIYSAIVISLAILIRTFIAVYFGFILFLLMSGFLFFILKNLKSFNNDSVSLIKKRALNLFFAGLIVGLVTLPFLWLIRNAIYNYYIIGHIIGPERFIRAAEAGVSDFLSDVSYYPESFFRDKLNTPPFHYSVIFLLFSVGIALLYKWFSILFSKIKYKNSLLFEKKYFLYLTFVCLTFFVPLVLLTLDVSKSPVVASILVVPFLWFFMIILVNFIGKSFCSFNYFWSVLAFFVLFIGIWTQVKNYTTYQPSTVISSKKNITQLNLDIGDYVVSHHYPEIVFSVNKVIDQVAVGDLNVLYFESRHVFLNAIVTKIGGGIFRINKNEILSEMKRSNVVVLFDVKKIPENKFDYPFNRIAPEMTYIIKKYILKNNFILLGNYVLSDNVVDVYVRKYG